MRVSYDEDLANRVDPESCACDRKVTGEALTGERMGQVLSRERGFSGVPTASVCSEGNTDHIAIARCDPAPRGLRPCARTEASRTGTGRSCVWS
jgi:hypothetical protein